MDPVKFRVAIPAADPPDNALRKTERSHGRPMGRFPSPLAIFADLSLP